MRKHNMDEKGGWMHGRCFLILWAWFLASQKRGFFTLRFSWKRSDIPQVRVQRLYLWLYYTAFRASTRCFEM